MQFIRIIFLSILAAVVYGIVHDQITARICVEYFTIGHPPIFHTQSPTVLGFGWGILATWWVGLILGVPLAVVARYGKRPKIAAWGLMRPILVLMGCMGGTALLAGIAGHLVAKAGGVRLYGLIASQVPPERHVAFLTDLWTHLTSYASGFAGGVILIVWVWRKRGQATSVTKQPPSAGRIATHL